MINHGKEIVRDYRRSKFWGKVKHILGVAFWKSLFASSVVTFLFAGFLSANLIAYYG